MYHYREHTSVGEKIITVVGFLVLTVFLFLFMVAYQITV